jgi:hypothetical protein
MKIYLAALLALSLCGCSDIDLFGDSTRTAEPAPMAADQSPAAAPAQQTAEAPAQPAPAPTMTASQDNAAPPPQPVATAESEPPAVTAARAAPAPNPAVAAHCKILAKQRAGDAAFQGEDPDTQETVYGTTYRDCVAWDAAHRS